MLKFPGLLVTYEKIRTDTIAMLTHNTRKVVLNGIAYFFNQPSRGHYGEKSWAWDDAWYMLVYASLGLISTAKERWRSTFVWQDPKTGRLPHNVFWDLDVLKKTWRPTYWPQYLETKGRLWPLPGLKKPRFTALDQPPIFGYALERIWEDEGDTAWLEEALPQFMKLLEYWVTHCDPDKDHLVSIPEAFSSGLDQCHGYDQYIGYHSPKGGLWLQILTRRFEIWHKFRDNWNCEKMFGRKRGHLEDVFVNTLVADQFIVLTRLLEAYQKAGGKTLTDINGEEIDVRKREAWAARHAMAITDALVQKCWNEKAGLFYSLAHRAEEPLNDTKTIINVMPVILATLPDEIRTRLIEEHLLDDKNGFWSPYPFTVTAMSEQGYGDFYKSRFGWHNWRGKLMVQTINWLFSNTLMLYGYRDKGIEARRKSIEAATQTGEMIFGEFFSSVTGELRGKGGNAKNGFGWGAFTLLMFEEPRWHTLPRAICELM